MSEQRNESSAATRWLVFFDSDYSVEASTPQEAAEEYAVENQAEFGQVVVVIAANPKGADIHRFRFGAVPEELPQ